jgi:signal transduction histidine kinase
MAERQETEYTRKDGRDQALDASRTQKAFLSHLRHELRTPLNAIIGYCEMLLEDAAERAQEDLIPDLQKIHVAAQRFLALINDLVNFSAMMKPSEQRLDPQASDTSAMSQEGLRQRFVHHSHAAHPTDIMGIGVAACEQDPSGLPTWACVGQRLMRIDALVGRRSVRMSQHSCAKGLHTRPWTNTPCE